MLEKSLSLPHARFILTSVGILVVLFGVADIVSRLGSAAFGSTSSVNIFGSLAAQETATSAITATTEPAPLLASQVVASTTPITPVRLKIPSIGVNAAVERVGNTAAGAMATPKSFSSVGWYSLGEKPGDLGSAVFAGHVNNALTKAGVFEHLNQVRVGDVVTVSDASDKTLVYTVSEIDEYPAEGAPTASIFTSSGPSTLVLITCDGSWDGNAHTFDKRLVVYAHLSAMMAGLR